MGLGNLPKRLSLKVVHDLHQKPVHLVSASCEGHPKGHKEIVLC